MIELLKEIPSILMYFIPGYLAVKIFFRIVLLSNTDKTESEELIPCIVISFLTTSIAKLFFLNSEDNNDVLIALISTGIAILFSAILSFVMRQEGFNKLFNKITRTDIQGSIWNKVIDVKKYTKIRCFHEFNHHKASIEGEVKYYDVKDDGGCRIALTKYKVTYYDDNLNLNAYSYDGSKNAIIYFETNDVGCIEIFSYDKVTENDVENGEPEK